MITFEVNYQQYEKIRFLQPFCDMCGRTIPNSHNRYEVVGKETRKHAIVKHQCDATDYKAIVFMNYVCSEECATMLILSKM